MFGRRDEVVDIVGDSTAAHYQNKSFVRRLLLASNDPSGRRQQYNSTRNLQNCPRTLRKHAESARGAHEPGHERSFRKIARSLEKNNDTRGPKAKGLAGSDGHRVRLIEKSCIPSTRWKIIVKRDRTNSPNVGDVCIAGRGAGRTCDLHLR